MAVHVLTLLAREKVGCVSSALLAVSVNTNPVVIRRLLLALQEANLVETRKGAGFGSRLSCSPASINLAEVYRAVEDHEPFVLPPKKPNGACAAAQGIRAALAKVFASAQVALERDLAQTTLADMLKAVNASRAGARKRVARVDRIA